MGNINEIVSVIVPVYNREKCIRKCIQSIQNQSYPDLEIIIVDDGSTDKTREICDSMQKEDARISVLHQKNQGVAAARNCGIDIAHGKYIQFVDSDDTIEPSMCEKLVNRQKETDADLVMCGYYLIDKKKEVHVEGTDSYFVLLPDFAKEFDYYLKNFLIHSPWNKLYIKEKIRTKFDTRYSLGEDLFFNIEYLSGCNSVAGIHDVLYNYNHVAFNYYREDGEKIATKIYHTLLDFVTWKLNSNLKALIAVHIIYIDDMLYQLKMACKENNWKVIKTIEKKEEFQAAIYNSKKYSMKSRVLLCLDTFHLWMLLLFYFKVKNQIARWHEKI